MKTARICLSTFCFAALLTTCSVIGKDQPAKGWTVVNGKSTRYLNLKEKEVVLKGTLIAEYYGKPGVNYFRAPYRYWLQTKKEKIALGPNDGIYMKLDKKAVEIKGKYLKGNTKTKRFFAGWIRVVAPQKGPAAN